jgi:uncharacterized protein, YigZ family
MPKNRISPAKAASAEFTERKSRFIGHISPVADENAAQEFIQAIKGEFADATHNVWAYTVRGGAVARCSDDGEPQGTAGMPVLDVLRKQGLDDCAVVVTRYFGGILLGAGGLVRAYQTAVSAAVEAAGVAEWVPFVLFSLNASYSDYQKLEYELPKLGAVIENVEFGAEVTLKLVVEQSLYGFTSERTIALTNGRSQPEKAGEELRPLIKQ